jgi:hypothetical protein
MGLKTLFHIGRRSESSRRPEGVWNYTCLATGVDMVDADAGPNDSRNTQSAEENGNRTDHPPPLYVQDAGTSTSPHQQSTAENENRTVHPPNDLIHPTTGEILPGRLTTKYYLTAIAWPRGGTFEVATPPDHGGDRNKLAIDCLYHIFLGQWGQDKGQLPKILLNPRPGHVPMAQKYILDILDHVAEVTAPGSEVLVVDPAKAWRRSPYARHVRQLSEHLWQTGFDRDETQRFVDQLEAVFTVLVKGEKFDRLVSYRNGVIGSHGRR